MTMPHGCTIIKTRKFRYFHAIVCISILTVICSWMNAWTFSVRPQGCFFSSYASVFFHSYHPGIVPASPLFCFDFYEDVSASELSFSWSFQLHVTCSLPSEIWPVDKPSQQVISLLSLSCLFQLPTVETDASIILNSEWWPTTDHTEVIVKMGKSTDTDYWMRLSWWWWWWLWKEMGKCQYSSVKLWS